MKKVCAAMLLCAALAGIAACDAFVYVGGESDEWVHDALKNTINSKQATVNLLELLGEAVRPEEIVEGEECR